MVGKLILRGMIAGLMAGLLAFGFAKAIGEPAVATAIQFESAQDAARARAGLAAGHPLPAQDPEIFSRAVQSGIGLLVGVTVVGTGLGGMFGVLFAFANGRLGGLSPQATAALLALSGLVALYIVPALKYPANPPSVGEPQTIALRTGLYFAMMAISVAAMAASLLLRRRLARTLSAWDASLLAAAAWIAILAIALLSLPAVNEVPATFPATTLWNFRLASLGIQTVLWLGTGLVFGLLTRWTMHDIRVLPAGPAMLRG